MIYPNYEHSIVNLTSSILKAFNINSPYSPLGELDDLKNYKNVVLFLIDGLGYEYVQKYGRDSELNKHCLDKITSVFPSTTASAVTALETGVAPQQHGITGWFMFLKELGVLAKILPFKSRYGGQNFTIDSIQRKDIFTEKRVVDKIKSSSFMIYPEHIIDGKVNKKSKSLLGYKNLDDLFSQIKKTIKLSNKRKYIYAYWDKFDYLCHKNGGASKEVNIHFWQLDKKISSLSKSLKGTNTALIITADHGLIDTIEKSKIILLQDHPELVETLTMPLSGEPRVAYCYVHPQKTQQFENYIKNNLSYCCEVYKSVDLLNKGVFGLFEPNKNLIDRIGDYILLMKENYIIKDFLLTEKKECHIGNHGGTSSNEMLVPLIKFDF
ncbi:MAG: alkaline phosphatase family protein [Candidatus Shapirobacteria bacterium]